MDPSPDPKWDSRLAGLSPEARQRLRERLIARVQPAAPPEGQPSFQQEQFWILHHFSENPSDLNILYPVRLEGPMDPQTLRQALDKVALQADTFQFRFQLSEERLQLTLSPESRPEWEIQEAVPAGAETSGWLSQAMERMRERPFLLDRDCPFRAALFPMADNQWTLALVFHHIALDGVSFPLFWKLLSRHYRAVSEGIGLPPLPEPVQYAAYAMRQQKRMNPERMESSRRYWLNALKGSQARLNLPGVRPDPGSGKSALRQEALPNVLREAVRERSRQAGVTENTYYLAAYFSLLADRLRQEDLCIGTPATIKPDSADQEVIGCCISTLCLRQEISPGTPFRELLHAVRENLLEALTHMEYPMPRLASELGRREASERELFQTIFQYRNYWSALENLGVCRARLLPERTVAGNFPLVLDVIEQPDCHLLSLIHSPLHFSQEEAQELLDNYRKRLERYTGDPDSPVREPGPPAIVPSEQRNVPYRCALDCLRQQAETRPHETAVEGSGRRLTYAGLDQRSDTLADWLRSLGAAEGRIVALHLQRSPELILAMLGVLKSGAAYLPLDPAAPGAWKEGILRESGAVFLLSDGECPVESHLPAHRLQNCPDGPAEPAHSPAPTSTAYVIYTSGSSGRPKGVQVSHGALSHFIHAALGYMGLSETDRVLQFAPPSFDASIEEIFPTLCAGATLVLRDDAMVASEAAFREFIEKHRISVASLPTGFWHGLTESWKPPATPGLPANWRLAIVGGESLSAESVRIWQRMPGPKPDLLNTYGPTEGTVVATTYAVPHQPERPQDPVPIGRLLPNLQARLLDSGKRPVAVGEPGELCLAGPGLADGYLNQPELTAEAFFLDPEEGEARIRWYRTGDRVRLRPDGQLEFLGRIDGQVKIRGYRVEPAQVEAFLNGLASVREACVRVAKDPSGNPALAAYLVLHDERAGVQPVREETAAGLPDYLQPAAWQVMEALPRTPGGKVDRQALPAPAFSASTSVERPRTATERELADLWRDLLKVEAVGRADQFFSLGGHSLLVLRLFSRIEQQFKVRPDLNHFLGNPVLSRLAKSIDSARSREASGKSGLAALSTEQRQRLRAKLLKLAGGNAGTPAYHPSLQQQYFHDLRGFSDGSELLVRLCVQVEGPLDLQCLEAAVAVVVKRHDIYRTVYREQNGALQAVVLGELAPSVEVTDVSGMEAEAAAECVAEKSIGPWNLEKESPLRVRIARHGETLHTLVFAFHHIASDGGSWNLFWSELARAYQHHKANRPLPAVEEASQYSRYARRQRASLKPQKERNAYWLERLANLPDPPLPPRDAGAGSTGMPLVHEVRRILEKSLWESVRETAREHRTTPHNVLLAAFHAWHYRVFGASDVVISTPVNGRILSGDEGVHGCTIFMLPIRMRLCGTTRFSSLLQEVTREMTAAYPHAAINPLELQLELSRKEGRTWPIQNALFQIRNILEEPEPLERGLASRRFLPRRATFVAPLLLELHLTPDGTLFGFGFDASRTSPESASRLLESYLILLGNLVAGPDDPLGQQSLLREPERSLLVGEWACQPAAPPPARSVPERFRTIARAHPESVALTGPNGDWSYAELDARSDSLAGLLLQAGAQPNDHVGVLVERGPEWVACLLAVLKAGAAYVPLDPEDPAERLRFIARDSGMSLLLADQRRLAEGLTECIQMVDPMPAFQGAAPALSAPDRAPDDPACLMYTSGTTGFPKGARIPHRGVLRLVCHPDYLPIGPDSVFLQLSSPAFDAATFEVWSPLLNGGKLVLQPPGQTGFSETGEAIRRHGVTTVFLTAGLFHAILDSAPEILSPLRHLLAGGDVLSPAKVADCRKRFPGLRLLNVYGPTENTTFSTAYPVPEAFTGDRPVPIGRPIARSEAFILDADGHPAPCLTVGELCVGGDGLALGYWKRPDLDAQAFIPHPFSSDPRARLYRTGDLARFLPDGQIEFIGRRDTQLKIRGFRVELSEIEAVMQACPAVASCCAFVAESTPESKRIGLAWTSGCPDTSATHYEGSLRVHAGRHLPSYMQPETWLLLETLPLTSNGKVDRAALARLADERPAPAPRSPTPASPAEARLLLAWQSVFPGQSITRDSDFFELGGDSLQAMRLMADLENHYNRRLPLALLFDHPRLKDLARQLG